MPLNPIIKPYVIIYNTHDKDRFRHLEKEFKVVYSDPHYFKVPELKYDYFWSDKDKICAEYRQYGIPHLDTLEKEEAKDVVQKQAEEVKQQEEEVTKEEVAPEVAAQEFLAPVEESLESLSWVELSKRARQEGLEGKFNKEQAIEFLQNK